MDAGLPDAWNQGVASPCEGLKGLRRLRVDVEPLLPQLVITGVMAEHLANMARVNLSTIGITDVEDTEPGCPWLTVRFEYSTSRVIGECFLEVILLLSQNVRLERDEKISLFVPTWQHRVSEVTPCKLLAVRMMHCLQVALTDLMKAWMIANGYENVPRATSVDGPIVIYPLGRWKPNEN